MADEEELQVDEDKKSGGNNLLVIIGAVVLGLGIGGAGVFFALGSGGDDAEEVAAEQEPERVQSQYHRLDKPFIVNFDSKGKQRYLQVDIQFRGKDEDAFEVITKHEPVVKNKLNNLLSSQELSVLQTDAGRIKLVADATTAVQDFLQQEIGVPGIDQVVFTTFVMQ